MGGGLQTWGEGHEITAPSNGVGHKNTRPFEGEVMKSTVKWQQSPPSYSIFANNFQGSTLVTPAKYYNLANNVVTRSSDKVNNMTIAVWGALDVEVTKLIVMI